MQLIRRLSSLVLVFAATLALAAPAHAGVLQASTAERPWNQEWASWSCADSSRFSEVTSPVNQGTKAYKLTVQDGDNSWGERCELGHGNPARSSFPLFHEGDDRWISFSVYLPDDYPIDTPDWNVMFQIHQEGDGGCPPIAMHVEEGEWRLFNSSSPSYVLDTVEKWHAPAERNRWTRFTIHLMNSGDDNTGFVELYSDLAGNGMQQVMPRTYMHTMTVRSDGTPMTNHARIGIYRNPAIQGTTDIYFDGFTIATDRASAEATAFGDAQPPVVSEPPTPDPSTATTTTTTTPPVINPVTITTPTPPSRPQPTKRKRLRRVVLRTHKAQSLVHASGLWPSVLPVYGWVKRGRHMAGRSVTIEIRTGGRWEQLARGWIRRSRRFYLAVPVEPGTSGDIMLRAHVAGVGSSDPVAAHL